MYLHVSDFLNAGTNPLKLWAPQPWHIEPSVRKVPLLRARCTLKNVLRETTM
jgi:hypothetical protein